MSAPLRIESLLGVAETEAWRIAVAKIGDRWVPVAIGMLEDGNKFINVLSTPGPEIGVEKPGDAVRLATAHAIDEEQGWGAVVAWHVPERQRATLAEYRCSICGEPFCWGHCDEPFY